MLSFFSDPAPDSPVVPQPAGITQAPLSNGQAWIYAVVLAAALAAGLVSLLVGELIVNAYQSDLFPRLSAMPSAEDIRKLKSAQVNSPAISFSVLGGLLGLAMGLAGGLIRRSATGAVGAGLLGLILGAGATGLVCWISAKEFYDLRDSQSTDLLGPLVCHGLIWLTAGATGGLALGVGMGGGRWTKTMGGAAAGAVVATLVYELIGALFFATSKTELPLSDSIATRAMAQILVAVLSAGGAVLAMRSGRREPAVSSVAA